MLISAVRRRAGLTQAELARRAGMTQPEIARLERPGANPRLSTLAKVLEAGGYEVVVRPRALAAVDLSQIDRHLAMTPAERLRAHAAAARSIASLRRARG
jgi:uncharacterized protein